MRSPPGSCDGRDGDTGPDRLGDGRGRAGAGKLAGVSISCRCGTGIPPCVAPRISDELSPAEITLLKELADKGAPVSEARLDANALRTLVLRRHIERMSGFSVITPDGRRALDAIQRGQTPAASPPVRHHDSFPVAPAPRAAPDEEEAPGTTVNTTQEDMLRQLALAAAVPFDDLDGRVVRALEGLGLARYYDPSTAAAPREQPRTLSL